MAIESLHSGKSICMQFMSISYSILGTFGVHTCTNDIVLTFNGQESINMS